ncbi:hypothetical protein [aff. Roholtiella sp. LEGE 12411]|nr:hypothetical protein [aff. Roholtiella sp. LEGE 12411]MBE9037851.1 hypothetical protein [aff. Roholtiella sp. LEGE 12411]
MNAICFNGGTPRKALLPKGDAKGEQAGFATSKRRRPALRVLRRRRTVR